MKVRKILETCLYSRDLDATERFYTQVLGCRVYSKVAERHVFFTMDDAMLLVFNPEKTMEQGKEPPPHGAFGEGHVAFAASEADYELWKQWLSEKQVAIEKEIAWPNGGRSVYFRDPSGNSLEFATPRTWSFETEAE